MTYDLPWLRLSIITARWSKRLVYNHIPEHVIAKHEFQQKKKTGKLRNHANKSSWPKTQMHPGQQVIAQHLLTKRWDQLAEIIENRSNGQSYLVRINNRGYLRNRRFLPPLPNLEQCARPEATPEIPRKNNRTTEEPRKMYTRREVRPTGPPERPRPTERNLEPRRSRRVRHQRQHYQAAIPKPKRRNRFASY